MKTKLMYVVLVHEDGCDAYVTVVCYTKERAHGRAKLRAEELLAQERRVVGDAKAGYTIEQQGETWLLSLHDVGVIARVEVQSVMVDAGESS